MTDLSAFNNSAKLSFKLDRIGVVGGTELCNKWQFDVSQKQHFQNAICNRKKNQSIDSSIEQPLNMSFSASQFFFFLYYFYHTYLFFAFCSDSSMVLGTDEISCAFAD